MKENRILGEGWTPGSMENQGTYRSKLFRLWGILYMLLRISTKYQIESGKVTIACGRLSSLKQAQ